MTDKEKDIQKQNFTDMILERPIDFMIGKEVFYIYPLTLGKMMLMSNLFKGIFGGSKSYNPLWSILRSAKKDKKQIAKILAYFTMNGKEEVFNSSLVRERADVFASKMDEKELTTTLTLAMQMDRSEEYIKSTHIDLELENIRRVQKVKKNTTSVHFGGRTIFGQMIDPLMERYGWSYDYVLWGISFSCVKILQADSIKEMYLSEQERKSVTLYTGDFINADDKANDELIDKELGLI